MVVKSTRTGRWPLTSGEPSLMQRSGSGTWAGRWSILVGACLAMIAAGSFVAFSLVARDAGLSGLAGRTEARRLSTTSPVVTLGELPTRAPRRSVAAGSDAVPGPTDMVLGTRFVFDEPTKATTTKDRKRRHHTGGNDTDTDGAAPVPARLGSSKPHKTGGSKSKSHGHSTSGPAPQGQAKGHDKARGNGHDKHGDH